MGICSSRSLDKIRNSSSKRVDNEGRYYNNTSYDNKPKEETPIIRGIIHTTQQETTQNNNNNGSTRRKTVRNLLGKRRRRRRDSTETLGLSISNTFKELTEEDPIAVEENSIRRAMELSMLDCALVIHNNNNNRSPSIGAATQNMTPYDILGVDKTASLDVIKAAYRKKALETHPDREGGSSDKFEAVARSYRTLLDSANRNSQQDKEGFDSSMMPTQSLKSTAHWDSELREHRDLVDELFLNHNGADIETTIQRQTTAIESLGLIKKEAGASNRNEKNERIRNSCFYLSLATSYLHGIGAYAWMNSNDDDILSACKNDKTIRDDADKAIYDADKQLTGETALILKRYIEAAVVSAHPEWATQGMVGEEVQAFSDFLVYTLDSSSLLSEWAVVVFDTSSGFADIYKGTNFPTNDNIQAQRSNTLTIRYVSPGHYQPLIPSPFTSQLRPTLAEILSTMENNDLLYVVTDGSAD